MQSSSPISQPKVHFAPLMKGEKFKTITLSGQPGEVSAVAYQRLQLSAAIDAGERTIGLWDLQGGQSQFLHYRPYSKQLAPSIVNASGYCFAVDQRHEGGTLGVMGSGTKKMIDMPHSHPALTVQDLKGATFGTNPGKASLVFWDLFTQQATATAWMEQQGRNLCASVPSQSSHLVVTLQSGTHNTPNLLALWDAREANKPVKQKMLHDGDILSLAVIQTLKGPRIVTRSVGSATLDCRGVFDEVFGEMTRVYDSRFGKLDASTAVPSGSGGFNGYNLSFLPSSPEKLNTVTTDRRSETVYGPHYISSTVRSYDFSKEEQDKIKPEVTVVFPTVNTGQPENGFFRDSEAQVVYVGESEKGKLFLLYQTAATP